MFDSLCGSIAKQKSGGPFARLGLQDRTSCIKCAELLRKLIKIGGQVVRPRICNGGLYRLALANKVFCQVQLSRVGQFQSFQAGKLILNIHIFGLGLSFDRFYAGVCVLHIRSGVAIHR